MLPEIDYREFLEDRRWETPDSYAGHDPVGHYVVYAQGRDSSLCDRSNYAGMLRDLKALLRGLQEASGDVPKDTLYTFRASHWACGWVEYIILDYNAPEPLLIEAAEMICSIADYPVYDDSLFSEMEHEELNEIWFGMDIRERAEYYRPELVSENIFCLRHDTVPASCFDAMRDGYSL